MADCATELQETIAKAAIALAQRQGNTDIDTIVGEMKKVAPAVNREIVVESLNAYRRDNAKKRGFTRAAKLQLQRVKREAAQDERLRKAIDAAYRHLEEGTLPEQGTRRSTPTDAIADLQGKKKALDKAIRDSDPAVGKRLRKSIKRLEGMLEKGLEKKPTVIERRKSREIERLEYKKAKLQQQVKEKQRAMAPKSVFQRVTEYGNVPRQLLASFDLPPMFRQGLFTTLSHPAISAKNFARSLQGLASGSKAHALMKSIDERTNAPLYKKAKLEFADATGILGKKEEDFLVGWLKKYIPGMEAVERGYAAYLNLIRADLFDLFVETSGIDGQVTIPQAQALANFINVSTGRGKLNQTFEQAVPAMNTLMFAPKYTMSRIQLAMGQPILAAKDANARKLIIKEYARALAGGMAMYALNDLLGFAEVEWDPRSSDFGKFRVGRIRLDPMGGLSQIAVLASRLATGETKSPSSGRESSLTEGGFGSTTRSDVVLRWLRYKLAPIPSALLTAGNNMTNAVGEQLTPGELAAQTMTPISFQEIREAMEEDGVPKGAALGIISIMGMGMGVFDAPDTPLANARAEAREKR